MERDEPKPKSTRHDASLQGQRQSGCVQQVVEATHTSQFSGVSPAAQEVFRKVLRKHRRPYQEPRMCMRTICASHLREPVDISTQYSLI